VFRPLAHGGAHLTAERLGAHRVDQPGGRRPCQRNAALARDPAHHILIVVCAALQLLAAVAKKEQRRPRRVGPPQDCQRHVGAFQVLRPGRGMLVQPGVEGLQCRQLIRRHIPLDGDQPVNVAVRVPVPDSERALQVRGAEVRA
jgi:hypothetical protein